MLETVYTDGQRIPTEDWHAYAPAGKERGDCLIVGCQKRAAHCEMHWISPERQAKADAAYSKGCHMAMAYCWGRGDMGDEVATDQANWYPFTRAYGRMQFDYALETRGNGLSVRSAWERFIEGEAL